MIRDYLHNRKAYEEKVKELQPVKSNQSLKKGFLPFAGTKNSMLRNTVSGGWDYDRMSESVGPRNKNFRLKSQKSTPLRQSLNIFRSVNTNKSRGKKYKNYMAMTCTFNLKNEENRKNIKRKGLKLKSMNLGSSRNPQMLKESLGKSPNWKVIADKNRAYPHKVI